MATYCEIVESYKTALSDAATDAVYTMVMVGGRQTQMRVSEIIEKMAELEKLCQQEKMQAAFQGGAVRVQQAGAAFKRPGGW